VEIKYKNLCYQLQTTYALETQGNDFAGLFDLCARFENGSRPTCYQGLGRDAAWQGIGQVVDGVAEIGFTSAQCMLGKDYEARSNCAIGAAKYFIDHYRSDAVAKTFCESLAADLRSVCLQRGEEHSKDPQPSAKSPKQELASAGAAPEPKATSPEKAEPKAQLPDKGSKQDPANTGAIPEVPKKAEELPKETWSTKEAVQKEPETYAYDYNTKTYPEYSYYSYGDSYDRGYSYGYDRDYWYSYDYYGDSYDYYGDSYDYYGGSYDYYRNSYDYDDGYYRRYDAGYDYGRGYDDSYGYQYW